MWVDSRDIDGGNRLLLLLALLLLLVALCFLSLENRLLDVVHLTIVAFIVEGHFTAIMVAKSRGHWKDSSNRLRNITFIRGKQLRYSCCAISDTRREGAQVAIFIILLIVMILGLGLTMKSA